MWRHFLHLTIYAICAMAITAIWRNGDANAAVAPSVTVLQPVSQGLRAPVRMALDADGNYYVADSRSGGVLKYDRFGALQQTIRTSSAPQAVAFSQDGKLLVSQGSFVAILNLDGSEAGRLDAVFKFANGIAVDDVTGFIYVVDSSAHLVRVFTAAGAYVKAIGAPGKANGQFSMPTGISFEKVSRQLAVVDTLNRRVQFFNMDGGFIKAFGPASTVPFYFSSPEGIAFEYTRDTVPSLSRMYVVDTYQGNVQVIDPAGNGAPLYLAGTNPLNNFIGKYGNQNGQLMVPSDVVFDQANSRLIVVNGFGNLTQYGIDGGTSPYTDNTPPILAIDPVPATILASSVTLTGTVESGATFQLSASSAAQLGEIVYTSSTTWQCQVTGLPAGETVITATARDAAGNRASAAVTLNYLLPAPVFTIENFGSLTTTAQQVLSGTVEEGAAVVLSANGAAVPGGVTVAGGIWRANVTLAEGSNHFTLTATKPLSRQAALAADITLDSIAPRLTVSALSNGSYTATQVQNVSGTVSDSGVITLTVNGEPAVVSNGSFSAAVTLANGSNQLIVRASDQAGNLTSDSRTIIFDANQPVITVSSPVDNVATSKGSIRLSGSLDKAASVVVAGLPAEMNGPSWSATVPLIPGVNTIEIVATDLLGNTSTAKRTVIQDSDRPALAILSPAQDLAINRPGLTISGTVSDSSATTLSCTVNGSVTIVPVVDGTFAVSLELPAEGTYPLLFAATDLAGNATYSTRTLIYDGTAPALTIDPVKGVAPEKLSGTVENDATVTVREGEVAIGTVAVENGTWKADLTGIAYDFEKLNVRSVDAAGNSTVKTLTYAFPDGDLNGDGRVTVQDALRAIRLTVNQDVPTPSELAKGDIGPLMKGKPNPNGKIDLVDAILILRKAVGLPSW